MKKIIFVLCLLSVVMLNGCSSSMTDYEKINQRLYTHYGWLYPDEPSLVDAFFRGTYIDEQGKLVIRIGIEKNDELYEMLTQEIKEVAWPSRKPMPEVEFISAKLSREEVLVLYDEICEIHEQSKINHDSVWHDVRGIGAGSSYIGIHVTDLTKEKAAAIRADISNPGPIVFNDITISRNSFYINDKPAKVVTRNSEYKKIIKNLEGYYGKIPEQFPNFRLNGYQDIEYQGCYIDSDGILVVLVGGKKDNYDENVKLIKNIAWPEADTDMPEVRFVHNLLPRNELLELHNEIWENIKENYFDKKSIWNDVTAVYQDSNRMGLEVRNLSEKKKSVFRSLVSYPHALYFRETRTTMPPQYIH